MPEFVIATLNDAEETKHESALIIHHSHAGSYTMASDYCSVYTALFTRKQCIQSLL